MLGTQEKYKPLDSLRELNHYTDWVGRVDSYPQEGRMIDHITSPNELYKFEFLGGQQQANKHVFYYRRPLGSNLLRGIPVLPNSFHIRTLAGAIEPIIISTIEDIKIKMLPSFLHRQLPTHSNIPVLISDFIFPKLKSRLEIAIEEASEILNFPENWNEEGAKQISKELFGSACDFLREYSSYLAKEYRIELDTPEINPVPDGTIDLSWRTKQARMLINIRNIDNVPHAFFYGDRYNNKMPVKGNTPVAEFSEGLAVWMKSLSA